jgi:hypothetical protein
MSKARHKGAFCKVPDGYVSDEDQAKALAELHKHHVKVRQYAHDDGYILGHKHGHEKGYTEGRESGFLSGIGFILCAEFIFGLLGVVIWLNQ